MTDKLIPMDKAYREKNYPNGYLAALVKSERGLNMAAIICGAVLALIGLGISALDVKSVVSDDLIAKGDISTVIILTVIALVFLLPGILLIRMGIRRMKMGEDEWIKKIADRNEYPASAIQEFANQAMEDESIQIQFGATGIKGVLTRDYICITYVVKIEDIIGAYLVETSNNINIGILSNHKISMLTVAKEDTIRQLLDMLTQRNPSIDTAGGRRLQESEYFKLEKECRKARAMDVG